jgi:hypothetical protein
VPEPDEVAAHLATADLDALGLQPEDQAELRGHVTRLGADDLEQVSAGAARLAARVGDLEFPWPRVLADLHDRPGRPMGLLPLMALVASADDVRRFHAARGIPAADSASGLRDLGQQVAVHRRTYGEFGLHTQGWLVCVWSGAYFWLGRLAFNLMRLDGRWVIDTHIPEGGPLTPETVDASFARARDLFGRHFADLPAEAFHCHSWLLDPQLADVLPADSNIVRFQRRWELYGDPTRGDDDAVFFVFRQRHTTRESRAGLPRDTTLQRAILDRIDAGSHWQLRHGSIPVRPVNPKG